MLVVTLVIGHFRNEGARLSKVLKTFRARKGISKTVIRLFQKAVLSRYERGNLFHAWKRLRFKDT